MRPVLRPRTNTTEKPTALTKSPLRSVDTPFQERGRRQRKEPPLSDGVKSTFHQHSVVHIDRIPGLRSQRTFKPKQPRRSSTTSNLVDPALNFSSSQRHESRFSGVISTESLGSTPFKKSASNTVASQNTKSKNTENDVTFELRGSTLLADDLIDHFTGDILSVDSAKQVLKSLVSQGHVRVSTVGERDTDNALDSALDYAASEAGKLTCSRSMECASSVTPTASISSQPSTGVAGIWEWTAFQTTYLSDSLAKDALNSITEAALQHPILSQSNRKPRWRWATSPWPNHGLPLPEANLKADDRPDLLLLPVIAWDGRNEGPPNKAFVNFPNLGAVGEAKNSKKTAGKNQLNRFIRQVKRTQPWRRFAFGLVITRHELCLLRSDQCGTEETAIKLQSGRGPLDFVRVLVALALATDEELGFDSRFELEYREVSGVVAKDITMTFKAIHELAVCLQPDCEDMDRFKIDNVLFNRSSLRSRATIVRRVIDSRGNPMALKSSWTDVTRIKEGHDEFSINALAKEKGVQHVVLADRVWTSYIGGTQDTVFDTIRALLPEFLNPDELTVENRCSRWLSMELRRPLSAFTGLYELVVSIAGAVRGHESLCNAGILHRDVSEGNIMLDMDPRNPKGWLIDLEMAVKWSEKDEQWAKETFAEAPDPSLDPDFGDMALDNADAFTTSPPPSLRPQDKWKAERTGTPPYMAIEILSGTPIHFPHHDLESFFYVLYLVFFTYNGPGSQPFLWPAVLQRWNDGPLASIAEAKLSFMRERSTVAKCLSEVRDHWIQGTLLPHVKHLVQQIYDALWYRYGVNDLNQGRYERRRDVTHEVIYKHLEEWASHPDHKDL